MKIILRILVLTTFFSCTNEQDRSINSKSETYTIECNKAYELKLKSNDIVVIKENTFFCSHLDVFDLSIYCLKEKKDIIFSGISTLSDDGRILESGGMFKLDYPSSIEINPEEPLEYRVANEYLHPNMQLFEYNSNSSDWTSISDEGLWTIGSELIEVGKESYVKNCSNCHGMDLSIPATGPALGRIEKFRSSEWLMDFTINSQRMIGLGDSISNCLWNQYKPTVMTSFSNLDTSEIRSIYAYIKNEAEVQKIKVDSSRFIVPCVLGMDSIDNAYYSKLNRLSADSDYYYIAKVYSNSWYNVDYFTTFEDEIENPELVILNSDDNVNAVVAFSNYNTVIQFVKYDGELRLRNSRGKGKIKWPIDEEIYLVVYQQNSNKEIIAGKVKKCSFHETSNRIEVNLDKMTKGELNEKLKQLEING